MASLTEISVKVRKIAVWVILALVAIFVVQLLIRMGIAWWKAAHPVIVKLPPPDVRFDKLPVPKFTVSDRTSTGIQFTLENIEGKPPETTESARVYSMPKKLPSILAKERAEKFAAKVGFLSAPQILGATTYKYIDSEEPNRSLVLDTVTMNFQLKYAYAQNPGFFSVHDLLSKDDALRAVKDYISRNNLFDDSFRKGETKSQLFSFDETAAKLVQVNSLSETEAIRFDFFRTAVDEWKVLPPAYDKSYTYALYTKAKNNDLSIFELSYVFWPIASDDYATYPLKSGQNAWQELVDGYATVVRMGNNTGNVVIRNIYLAYYDSEEPQLFLQPIFVFEGDNTFVAYLPAISSEWLE